jgi:hypothetical protein
MTKSLLRSFTKPKGYDQRIRRELTPTRGAEAEAGSFAAARARAERLKLSLDDMLLEDRRRLRASTYPGPECLEPYEVEEYAAGALSRERAQHVETCEGCHILVSGVTPSEAQVAAFLDEVSAPEPDAKTLSSPMRSFWSDLVAASTAAVIVTGLGYFGLQWVGSAAKDPSVRSAVASQVTTLVSPAIVATLFVLSLLLLTGALWRYGQRFLTASSGALTGGLAFGLLAIWFGGRNIVGTADSMRAVLKLQQVQLTETVAASLGPDVLQTSGSGLDAKKLHIEPSSLVRVEAWQSQPGRVLFQSSVDGLPGTMLADMQANGGQLYWDFANKKQPLNQILYGTVESSTKDEFVLVDPDQRKHVIKIGAGTPVNKGSQLMVLVDPAGQTAISVHSLTSKYSTTN